MDRLSLSFSLCCRFVISRIGGNVLRSINKYSWAPGMCQTLSLLSRSLPTNCRICFKVFFSILSWKWELFGHMEEWCHIFRKSCQLLNHHAFLELKLSKSEQLSQSLLRGSFACPHSSSQWYRMQEREEKIKFLFSWRLESHGQRVGCRQEHRNRQMCSGTDTQVWRQTRKPGGEANLEDIAILCYTEWWGREPTLSWQGRLLVPISWVPLCNSSFYLLQ